MQRKNVVSSISKLPAIASASAIQEDSMMGSMKGRHRSVTNSKTLNTSYTGRKGAALLNNKNDINSQQSLLRHKMPAPDISSEVLDVRIQNTDNR